MPVYGQFETVTELGRAGAHSTYRARAADGGWDVTFGDLGSDANYVLKVFHADLVLGPAAAAEEARRFLERARSQRRVADAGAAHWVPVLDAGTTSTGDAYCVTPFYPRTAANLASPAAGPLDAPAIYGVVAGVLDGLLELRNSHARPHGNLRPGNVLIDAPAATPASSSARGAAATAVAPDDVRLTDPALERDAVIGGESEDLYNLGEILYALVLRAKFPGQHTLPVLPSHAWSLLGKRGDDWRALCNDLLAARADAPAGLHDVAARVAGMATSRRLRLRRRTVRPRSRKVWVAAAALAVVTGLGAAEYVHYTRAWRDLCAAHAAWLGPLADRLAKDTPREFAADPYLSERVVAPLADARRRGIELNPRLIAGSDQTTDYLVEHPPKSLGAVWETERAWRVASRVGQSLQSDRWTAATDAARRRADYDRRGWPKLAQFAGAAADRAQSRQDADWVSAAVAVLDANARLARLDAARDAGRTRLDLLVARAAAAPALREKIGEFELHLRRETDADAAAPTPDAVDALARQIADADRVVAQFDKLIPELAEAARFQRLYELRGWTGPARHLDALIDRAKPTTAPADLAALPAAIAADRRLWERAERTWTAIENRRRTFENSGDRVLATYPRFVAAARPGDAPDLNALAHKLDTINDDPTWNAASAKVQEDDWAKLDLVAFAQRSQAHRNFDTQTGIATPALLSQWLADLEGRGGGTQLASATMTPNGTGQDRPPVMTVPAAPPTTTAPSASPPTPATQKSPDPVVVAATTNDKPPVTQPTPGSTGTAVADAGNPTTTRPAPETVASGNPPAPVTRPAGETFASANPPPAATQKSPNLIAAATPTTRTAATLASVPPPDASPRPDVPAANTPKPAPTTLAATGGTGTSRPVFAAAVGRDAPRTDVRSTPPPPTQPTTVAVAPKPPAPPPPDPEQVRRAEEIRAFIVDCREVGLAAKSREKGRELKEAWRAKNLQIADAIEKDPKLFTPALKEERSRLRARLLQLDRAAAEVAAPLALTPGPAKWNAALVEALRGTAPRWDDRFATLTDLAVRGQARFDADFDAWIRADQDWRASAAKFVADANRADRLLADGYSPDDRTTVNSSLVATLRSLQLSELHQNDAVRDALEPLLGPANVVKNETGARALRLLAASKDQPLGIRLAAWFKTARDVSRQALDEDLRIADNLLAAARDRLRGSAPDRVESIKTWLETDLRGRWLALLDTALRPEEVAGAIAMRDRITGVELTQLPPRARANFALHDLRAALASARGEDAAAAVAPAAKQFRDAALALEPAQRAVPAISNALAEINRVDQGAAVDFRQLGPMSEAGTRAIRWSVAADETGDRVTYSGAQVIGGTAGTDELVLTFRRVRPPEAGGRSTWICTTETSLGVFSDLLTAAGKWPDLRASRWLPDHDSTRGDLRPGPRVWEWPRYGRAPDATWTRTWLGTPGFIPARVDHYPPEIAADLNRTQIGNPRTRERAPELNPSRRMPMQYVSAKAAQYAASLAGCRLPTVAEWQAASRSSDQAMGVGNVRDQTWRLELEYLQALRLPGGVRLRPDAGMFVPAGERPSDEVWRQASNNGEVVDGVLWFREVSSGSSPPAVFVDLAGNVAEFVTGDAGRVYVVGASALSPPPRVRDPNKAFEVGADQATSGFSDVGFRLAFAEPAVGVERLREAVAGNWYLTAK